MHENLPDKARKTLDGRRQENQFATQFISQSTTQRYQNSPVEMAKIGKN